MSLVGSRRYAEDRPPRDWLGHIVQLGVLAVTALAGGIALQHFVEGQFADIRTEVQKAIGQQGAQIAVLQAQQNQTSRVIENTSRQLDALNQRLDTLLNAATEASTDLKNLRRELHR